MDVSQLSINTAVTLAEVYRYADTIFRASPPEAASRRQRKIRRWMCRYIRNMPELPKETRRKLLHCEQVAFFAFLQHCMAVAREWERDREDAFRKAAGSFDVRVQSALRQFLRMEYWPDVQNEAGVLRIVIEDTPAFRRTLVLTEADGVPAGRAWYFCKDLTLLYSERENRYCICGALEEPTDNAVFPFEMTFASAEVQVSPYNACAETVVWENPWCYLRGIALSIAEKADLPGDCCNAAEKEQLSLLRELAATYGLAGPEGGKQSFDALKRLARKHGVGRAVRLFEKLEAELPGTPEYGSLTEKLFSVLSLQKNAAMWREIFAQIRRAQEGFPKKAEALCPDGLLRQTRAEIQRQMEAHGYVGAYPDFTKEAFMKGLHLETSYGKPCIVGRQRARYFIHCTEAYADGSLTVSFLCGTALLKKDDSPADVFDCLFNADGKRLFCLTHHTVPPGNGGAGLAFSLKAGVDIAVKKAEFQRLTKQEKSFCRGSRGSGLAVFLGTFLIAGGICAVFVTLAMLLVCTVFTVFIHGCAAVPDMLAYMPWWFIFVLAWVLFGGILGLLERK